MTIQQLIDYCESMPDKSAHVAFAEWNHDGHHFVTPLNLPHKQWKPFERDGVTHQVLISWDSCHAHKIAEHQLKAEAKALAYMDANG